MRELFLPVIHVVVCGKSCLSAYIADYPLELIALSNRLKHLSTHFRLVHLCYIVELQPVLDTWPIKVGKNPSDQDDIACCWSWTPQSLHWNRFDRVPIAWESCDPVKHVEMHTFCDLAVIISNLKLALIAHPCVVNIFWSISATNEETLVSGAQAHSTITDRTCALVGIQTHLNQVIDYYDARLS